MPILSILFWCSFGLILILILLLAMYIQEASTSKSKKLSDDVQEIFDTLDEDEKEIVARELGDWIRTKQ